jgi:hypothetical protein
MRELTLAEASALLDELCASQAESSARAMTEWAADGRKTRSLAEVYQICENAKAN